MPKQAVSYEAVWGWGCFSREASFLSARQTKVKLPYEPRLGRQVSPDLAERRACPRTNATPRREPLGLTGVASKQLEAVWGCCCLYPTYTGPPRCRMLVGRWHGTRLKRQRRRAVKGAAAAAARTSAFVAAADREAWGRPRSHCSQHAQLQHALLENAA